MSGFFEKLATINQALRTGIVLAATAGIGYGGYWGYDRYIKPALELESVKEEYGKVAAELETARATMLQQQQQIGSLEKDNDRLSTSLRLIKVDTRLAYLTVTDLAPDPETGEPMMKVLFTEVDGDDKPVGFQRVFTLRGKLLNVDCWFVKFNDKYIEQADIARGASLCVIRGIKGDLDSELQAIDQGTPYSGGSPASGAGALVDNRPATYRSMGETSEFEQKIWADFWSVANDVKKQEEMGIRANHGQVNYVQVEAGKTYRLDSRASDGGTLKVVDPPPAIALPKSPGA